MINSNSGESNLGKDSNGAVTLGLCRNPTRHCSLGVLRGMPTYRLPALPENGHSHVADFEGFGSKKSFRLLYAVFFRLFAFAVHVMPHVCDYLGTDWWTSKNMRSPSCFLIISWSVIPFLPDGQAGFFVSIMTSPKLGQVDMVNLSFRAISSQAWSSPASISWSLTEGLSVWRFVCVLRRQFPL